MQFRCKTDLWVSYKKDEIIDVKAQWENIQYKGVVTNMPFFYKKCELFDGEKVRKKFYLFPDQFELVEQK